MSLAAQSFIASISHDSLQIYKQRRKQTLTRLKDQGLKDQKTTFFTEDLAEALQEVGCNSADATLVVLVSLCIMQGILGLSEVQCLLASSNKIRIATKYLYQKSLLWS